jgi:transcriptional regulator with XRE-family HTH domain
MDYNGSIGARIKELRIRQKLTLKQLSQRSGLSVGFLSQLERGISTIAIDSLATLAKILNVSLSSFFQEQEDHTTDPVVHSFDQHFSQVNPQIIQYILSHHPSASHILPRIFTLLPMANTQLDHLEVYRHEGEEFIYVLEGIVTVMLDDNQYTLYPGDSIMVDSTIPHNWINYTNQVAKILTINYPNPFHLLDTDSIVEGNIQ